MSTKAIVLSVLVVLGTSLSANASPPPEVLDGDEGSACAAILCLASGSGISACLPSLRAYFSIWDINPVKLIKKRFNFLNLCPVGDAGEIARNVNENYGRCGTSGYESAACLGYGIGSRLPGNCYNLVGSKCTNFVPNEIPDDTGIFGTCLSSFVSFTSTTCLNFREAIFELIPGDDGVIDP